MKIGFMRLFAFSTLRLFLGGLALVNLSACFAELQNSSFPSKVQFWSGVKLTVLPIYPGNSDFLEFVKNNGADVHSADNTSCLGTENTKYDACIHGAEYFYVDISGAKECGSLSLTDQLGLFDWSCSVTNSGLRFRSTGFKLDKGIRDAIQTSGVRPNHVVLRVDSSMEIESESQIWWKNTVRSLPVHTERLLLDGVDDDGAGPDLVFNPGDLIYVPSTVSASTYLIGMDKLGFVVAPDAKLRVEADGRCTGSGDWNNGSGDGWGTGFCLTGQNFFWFEGELEEIGSMGRWFTINNSRFSRMRNVSTSGATFYGIAVSDAFQFKATGVSSIGDGSAVNCSGGAVSYSEFKNFTVQSSVNNGFNKVHCGYMRLVDSTIDASGDHGIGLNTSGGAFVEIENVKISNSTNNGIWGEWQNDLLLKNVEIINSGNIGYLVSAQRRAKFRNVSIANSVGSGFRCNHTCIDWDIDNLSIHKSGAHGLELTAGSNIYGWSVSNLRVTGSVNHGLSMLGTGRATHKFVGSLFAMNGGNGVYFTKERVVLSHSTIVNNGLAGVVADGALDSNLSQLVVANNAGEGLVFNNSNNIVVDQLVTHDNSGSEVRVAGTSQNLAFNKNILINTGSGGVSCDVAVTASNPGMANSSCALQDASQGVLKTNQSTNDSFVGKVVSNELSNPSDSSGSAIFSGITNWVDFENLFRGWGNDGSAYPNANNRSYCSSGTCRIWDFRLKSNDTQLLNLSSNASSDNLSFSSSSTCPLAVSGDYSTASPFGHDPFLTNAREIRDDSIGDNDGVCESNEACIYSPNFGYYQGEGDYSSLGTCNFEDGVLSNAVTGVTMYSFSKNGAD